MLTLFVVEALEQGKVLIFKLGRFWNRYIFSSPQPVVGLSSPCDQAADINSRPCFKEVSSMGLGFLNPTYQRLCTYYCVYTWKLMYFQSLFLLPYTKVIIPSLSLMLLPILSVS